MTDTVKTTPKSSKSAPIPGAEMSESIDTPTLESMPTDDGTLYVLTSTVMGSTIVLGIFNLRALLEQCPALKAIDSGEFIDRDESGNGLTAYPCRPHIV